MVCRALIAEGIISDCAACSERKSLREIDRMNSAPAIGYLLWNCGSLCYFHNSLKREGMNIDQLMDRCRQEPRFRACANRPRQEKKKKSRKKKSRSTPQIALAVPSIAQGELALTAPEQPKPPAPAKTLPLFGEESSGA